MATWRGKCLETSLEMMRGRCSEFLWGISMEESLVFQKVDVLEIMWGCLVLGASWDEKMAMCSVLTMVKSMV